jgi:hypothetical protein
MSFIFNKTTNEKVSTNDDFFSFHEIIHFLKNIKYWKPEHDIVIAKNDYCYSYIHKSIYNVCRPFKKPKNATSLIFTLELMIDIENYMLLQKKYPTFNFKVLGKN